MSSVRSKTIYVHNPKNMRVTKKQDKAWDARQQGYHDGYSDADGESKKLVKKYEQQISELEAENKKLNMETYEQMELMKKGIERIKELEKENEELKTMVNRNAGDAIYHQAEKIKLQDINATLKAQLEAKIKE